MTLEPPQLKSRYVEMAVTPDRKLRAEIQELPLRKLKLDQDNVRFHHLSQALTDQEIEEFIWKENDTKDLFREILTSRGLSEAPIIDSNYVVKEGNRRVVCLRKLSERTRNGEYPGITENHWDTVTCYLLPKDTPKKDIAILLGRFHVSGKKEWRALNQAAHISELYNKHGLSQDDIRNFLSMSKATVNRMIKAFDATTEYGKNFSQDKEWVSKFSYFYEMYKKPKLADWLEKNGNTQKFMEWLAKGRLIRGMEVRKLPEIIDVPEAAVALDSSGFKAALEVLSRTDPSVDSQFYASLKDMVERLNSVPREELVEAGSDPVKVQALQKLRDTADEVLRNIQAIKQP